MAAPIRDKNGDIIEEGDVIKCTNKKRPSEVIRLYVKYHNGLGCLVVCKDEDSQFHFKTLKGISDEYHLVFVDDHKNLYM